MTPTEQLKNVKDFVKRWNIDCKEDGNTAPFWLRLLGDVFGVEHPGEYIQFEETFKHEEKGNSLFVDAWIPSVNVLIEQKASNVELDKPYKRHGREFKSVYEQAAEYDSTLPRSQRSRYIIACNFHEFWIYDMDVPEAMRKPIKLALNELPEHFHQLDFLVNKDANPKDVEEVKVSVKAGELVGKLYDALLKQYKDPTNVESQKSLNVLCVRIVFCLYAEDSGLFGGVDQFMKYLEGWKWQNARDALIQLFKVLDTKIEDRDPYLREDLAVFPYVNGGLFHNENIEVPRITEEIYHIIVDEMSRGFDWSVISPCIFGAVLESTLNPETRRTNGCHFTSVSNIMKILGPMYLNDLNAEFKKIVDVPDSEKFIANRKETTLKYDYKNKLEAFQNKLASLTFFDPACGSGNLLTQSFICLRRLENKVIEELTGGYQLLDLENPIKVSISQFYGIEINDFAVTVAKTALWIAESQMMKETEDIIRKDLDFLPLKTNAYIHEGNALKMDWDEILPQTSIVYAISNPPYRGARLMNSEQKNDVLSIFKGSKNIGNLDYVACWFMKAANLMHNRKVYAAFVSTNSITQGEQVATLWKPLLKAGVHIDFAYRTFQWDSEATNKAHVYCVIIGFSNFVNRIKYIYDNDACKTVNRINPYLVEAPDVLIESRNKALCDVPEIGIGNKPIDGGNYLFTKKEMDEFVKKEPKALSFFRPWVGAKEFINGEIRYCLWLGDCSIKTLRNMPLCYKRVKAVQELRLASKSAGTRKIATTPTRFHVENMPTTNYLLIPRVTSEKRRYIPIGYVTPNVICSDATLIIPQATMFHFGVLTSNVHMAWMRTVAGRLEMRYRYSGSVVYNTFPWPTPTDAQKARIEKTAQGILDARANHPGDSLADLYDPLLMPADLRKAHIENDKAVMEAYGFDWHTMKEEDCVAELMKMYQKLVEKKDK